MQASQLTIEREFEALRDIRRRSSSQGGPGALILDPDLPAEHPANAPPLSPQAWAGVDASAPLDDTGTEEGGGAASEDPFHLFWVPAHLHPELAPSEFRAFLKEHARSPAEMSAAPLSRSSSAASNASLGRKSSMLRRQYKPSANDGIENEHVVPLARKKSVYQNDGPQLTISDLQRLEELADEASKSDDPTKLRRVIRRSLSLNVAPSSVLDQMDDMNDVENEADSPIIIPPPNQILRRAARTKIRKPGLVGDGGGHRFPATRRRASARAGTSEAQPTSDGSSNDHDNAIDALLPALRAQKPGERDDELSDNRRMTYTEETSIYDAYADGPDEKEPSPTDPSTSPTTPVMVVERPTSPPSPPEPVSPPQPPHVLHQPQPQRHLSPVVHQQPGHPAQQPSRTPSPEVSSGSLQSSYEEARRYDLERRGSDSSSFLSTSPTAAEKRKEKDKKGILRKWGAGSDKATKKGGKEKERDKAPDKDKDKDKDSGFFGSLFGGGKKKQEEQAPHNLSPGAGPAAAAALLGASKSSKGYQPSLSPQLGNPYARYPIHVERAVYRLSHIKLANPRRPLYEQVLISNLMFWYLGVINKQQQSMAQTQQQHAPGQAQGQGGQPGAPQAAQGQAQGQEGMPQANAASEKEHLEREREERERERMEREMMDRERPERPEMRREARRGSLTKTPAAGSASAGGRRAAEMPVKGPQYGLQHQVIEQEYGGPPLFNSPPSPMARTASAPPGGAQNAGYTDGYNHNHNANHNHRPLSQPPKQPAYSASNPYPAAESDLGFYYGRPGNPTPPERETPPPPRPPRAKSPPRGAATGLPPGAMAPISSGEQLWIGAQPSSEPGSFSAAGDQSWFGAPMPGARSAPPISLNYSNAQPAPVGEAGQFHHPRPARSPPPSHYSNHEWNRSYEWDAPVGGGGLAPKGPSRSLSANAVAPSGGGVLKKKVASAVAAPADRRPRTSEGVADEDVPLAVWQQQRRK